MQNPLRCFEPYGIYISIVFEQGHAAPAWLYTVEHVGGVDYISDIYLDYDLCEKEALIKASEIVQIKLP